MPHENLARVLPRLLLRGGLDRQPRFTEFECMSLVILPPEVAAAAARLHAAGFATVVVGGAVRDSLLGRPAKDWDLATAATPEQVLRVFPAASVTTRFGTTLVPSAAGLLEVTTFRSEADYADYRRPSTVSFTTDLAQDLSRRDFTVNALAYDPASNTVIDLFGGQSGPSGPAFAGGGRSD